MAAPALAVLTEEQLRAILREEMAALRVELERLRGGDSTVLVTFPEAARRLGISLRSVQQRAKDRRLEVVDVGGERLCRLPASLPPR
jgi:predicted DNA-binding protein (UPF0251 family)